MADNHDRSPNVQYRPFGKQNAPMYSPHRDIAALGPALFTNIVDLIRNDKMPVSISKYLREKGVSQKDLLETLSVLAKSFSDRKLQFSVDVLEFFHSVGYLACPAPARLAIESMFGQMILATYMTQVADPLVNLDYIEFDSLIVRFAEAVKHTQAKLFSPG